MTHADKLYRDEGWQIITDAALGIPPTDVESQARTVARWSHEEITRLRAEIARCHARLEIDRVFVMGAGDELIRKEVPEDERLSMPDGIDARDATIREIEEQCDRLRALNAELVEALEACPLPSTMGNVKTHYGRFYDWHCKYVERALAKAKGREP